ncbi:hypothetical protein [Nocardioides sp. BYT-33-1]|uniref:hypothetical protein n=1 Tax=Nocardioides sp. BYT-33-1 TaxID=3416952 RepID=UPI003F53DA85
MSTQPEQAIRRGQTWERVKDGTKVVIVDYSATYDDVAWETPDKARRGKCFACYFRRRYFLAAEVPS